jgi:hypothetical protein
MHHLEKHESEVNWSQPERIDGGVLYTVVPNETQHAHV